MEQQKTNIIQTIDRMQHELLALSHQIHDHPELGYEEHQAVASIRSFLEDRGFQVETPYCGLDTSFKVVKKEKVRDRELLFLRNTMRSAESVMAVVTISSQPVP